MGRSSPKVPAMKRDCESELKHLSERMLRAGTKAGQSAGDIAHQALHQWASIWHRVLGEGSYFPKSHDAKPRHDQVRFEPMTFGNPKAAQREPARRIGIRPSDN